MKTGKLKNGFKYKIDESVLDDMRVLDALAEVDSGENPLKISWVIKTVLGEEQREKLYDALKDENGRVPSDAVVDALVEMLSESEEGKNS